MQWTSRRCIRSVYYETNKHVFERFNDMIFNEGVDNEAVDRVLLRYARYYFIATWKKRSNEERKLI